MSSLQPNPEAVLQTAFSVWSLKSLPAAVEFGVCTRLASRRLTDADFRQWCGEVGFKRIEVIHLAEPSSAAAVFK